jgi:hypothetical protein
MAESLLNLSQYTASGDCREFANKVVDIGGYLGVCNGHYLIVDTTTKGKHYGFYDFHEERKQYVSGYKLESQLQAIQRGLNNFEWIDMPIIKEDHYKTCDACNEHGKVPARDTGCSECKGSGQVELENDYNTYEVDCKSCDGDGNELLGGMESCDCCKGSKKHLNYVPVLKANDDWSLNGQYVLLFENLPKVKLYWHEKYEYFLFKFTNGFGVIMPIRTNTA